MASRGTMNVSSRSWSAAGIGALRGISGFVLAFLAVSICYDALARTIFSAPTDWSLEVSGFLVLYLGTVGAIEALATHGHIRLTLFSSLLPLNLRRLAFRLVSICGALFCGMIAWKGGLMAMDAFAYNERVSSAFGTPLFIPYVLLPIGFGVMTLQFLIFAFGPVVAEEHL
jgi:TRAP-type C4-dicarboxylate transport system permease small subunit